jgi:hypothetical protein
MKITKQQLKQIIKEELTESENMRDLPTVMDMLRRNDESYQYMLLNKIPAEMIISVGYELGIDIIQLIQEKLQA